MTFVREQGVVGLAVGLAIGLAATDTVQKLVEGIINPIIALVVGTQDGLEAASWTVNVGGRSAEFMWGSVLSSLITLLATALVIYLIVHYLRLGKLNKKKA